MICPKPTTHLAFSCRILYTSATGVDCYSLHFLSLTIRTFLHLILYTCCPVPDRYLVSSYHLSRITLAACSHLISTTARKKSESTPLPRCLKYFSVSIKAYISFLSYTLPEFSLFSTSLETYCTVHFSSIFFFIFPRAYDGNFHMEGER